jgi:hypothetical protein
LDREPAAIYLYSYVCPSHVRFVTCPPHDMKIKFPSMSECKQIMKDIYIDKESLAVLRANGLTEKEVRKVIREIVKEINEEEEDIGEETNE